jgi:ABC-2 type transport system ATP-binding protein
MIQPTNNTMQSESIVDVQDLTKKYGDKHACDRINIQIGRGMTFGLLGPNGAGKSTLIRMLMGLTPSDSGSIRLFGHETQLNSTEMRQRIGYVPELHYIYRWMTVDGVIKFVSQLYDRWDSELAEDLLARFELPNKKKVGTLSKGMTAKLGLVIALAHNPELLILDEPASGLDPLVREDFLESVLQNHTCRGRTILFSSHHVDDVERVSDEVGILANGKLVIRGSVDELRTRIKRVRVVLRDGHLPRHVPSQVCYQKLSRRDWLVTVSSFSEQLLEELRSENEAVSCDVIDLNLEEIFKDVVRGSVSQGEAS